MPEKKNLSSHAENQKEEKKEKNKKKKGVVIGVLGISVAVAIAATVLGAKGCAPGERSYTVTYLTDDEVQNFHGGSVTVKEGTTIEELKRQLAPVEGYDFKGFYKDEACTEPYGDDERITDNSTIYIEYEEQRAIVKFYEDRDLFNNPNADESKIKEVEVGYYKKLSKSDLMQLEKSIEREGVKYNFTGWQTLAQDESGHFLTETDLVGKTGKELIALDADGDHLLELFANYDVDGAEYALSFDDTKIQVSRVKGEQVEQLTAQSALHYGDVLQLSDNIDGGDWYYELKSIRGLEVLKPGQYKVIGDVSIEVGEAEHRYLNLRRVGEDYVVEGLKSSAQVKEVNIPSTHNDGHNIVEIDKNAFSGTDIQSIIIGENITKICYGAFQNCGSLSAVTFSNSLASVEGSAFFNCNKLSKVDFLGTVQEWANIDFQDHFGNPLTYSKQILFNGQLQQELEINFQVKQYAFYNCENLQSLKLGEMVDSLGSHAFYGCINLAQIQWNSTSVKDFTYSSNVFGKVGEGTNGVTVVFGESVHTIPSCCLYYATNVKSITISKNITKIGTQAFYNCTGLEQLDWRAENVESFSEGNQIFSNAGNAGEGISVTFSNSVKAIPAYCFYSAIRVEEYYYDSIQIYSPKIKQVKYSGTAEEWVSHGLSNGFYNGYDLFIKDSLLTSYTFTSNIPTGALKNVKSLTTVTMGDSVASIGDNAFEGCTGLTNVTIGSGVTDVGSSAFSGCTGLTSITIPESVTTIDNSAFNGCTGLTSITIPEGVTTIGNSAFNGCTNLVTINWNATNMTSYGSSVFENAGKNGDGITVIFGNTVQSIPAYCFYVNSSSYKPNIKSVTIGSNVTTIGNSAFEYCTNLTQINWNAVNVENFTSSYTSSSNVFRNAGTNGDGITVTFGETVTNIPAYCLEDANVESITIGTSVISIGNSAFYNCTGLTGITVPESVTTIGNSAFSGCTNLVIINWNAANVQNFTSSLSGVFDNAGKNGDGITVVFGESVKSIPAYCFYSYNNYDKKYYSANVTNVTIGSGVTTIGNSAFSGCTGLTGITIPESVTTIGNSAFSGCTNLVIINWNAANVQNFTSSLSGVFDNAGKNGDGITVVFGESVKSIPAYCFYSYNNYDKKYYSANVTNVTIGSGVTTIGSSAFYNCKGLTNITMGSGVTTIGSSAFDGCTGLNEVNYTGTINQWASINFGGSSSNPLYYAKQLKINNILQKDISIDTSISSYAFYNYSGLTSITMGENVTQIGSSAFDGCTGLNEVNYTGTINQWASINFGGSSSNPLYYAKQLKINNILQKDISIDTSISSYAFYNYSGLTRITIGINVTSIGDHAFYHCTGLTNITIPENVTSIGDHAFYHCTDLTNITIPENVTSIGNSAFEYCTNLTQINWNAAKVADFKYNSDVFYNAGTNGDGITVTFGETVTNIPAYCLEDANVESITIGTSVISIGNSAFYNCTGLNQINWNAANVTDFTDKSNVFRNAGRDSEGITVIFGDTVESIPAHCFYVNSSSYRPNIKIVTIGNSVTSIGDYAFRDCTGLTTVYYNGSKDAWKILKSSIGLNNTSLTSATIYYFSAEDPYAEGSELDQSDNYWHYEGEDTTTPVVWPRKE